MAAPPRTLTVTASTFGGPGDPGTGSTGYRGDNLNAHPDSFAELSNPGTLDFSALGNLPHGTPVTVTNPSNGRSLTLYKRDVGKGGGGIGGTKRGIDLWYKAAQQLGVNGLGVVKVTIGGKPGAAARSGPGGGGGGGAGGATSIPIQTTTLDQAAFDKAQNAYKVGQFLTQSSNPFSANDAKGAQGFGGGGSKELFAAGLASSTPPDPAAFQKTSTTMLKLAQNSLQGMSGKGLNVHPGATPGYKGYVNPLPGFSLGRTDMGVDASARVGTPIRAIGDSQVVGFSQNWYKGQPYVLFKFLNGPKAGQYWYVAEQVSPHVHSGQVVHAGETVGTFAPSGTGIEIGFGSPTPGRTQAQATTGYSEGQVTPAGSSFRNLLGSLGAR